MMRVVVAVADGALRFAVELVMLVVAPVMVLRHWVDAATDCLAAGPGGTDR